MSEPVVIYESIITQQNVTASAEMAGFPIESIVTPMTDTSDSWRFVLDDIVTVDIDAERPVPVSAVGMVCFGIVGSYVNVQYSDDGDQYIDFLALYVARDGSFMDSVDDAIEARYWRIEFEPVNGAIGLVARVPRIMLGEHLKFERCVMRSHKPIVLNRTTEYQTSESGTGQYLGRSIKRQNFATDVSFPYISSSWARVKFQPFVVAARQGPYFFSWNPERYPQEAAYVWTDEDIGIDYTGELNYMSSSWSMRGLADDANRYPFTDTNKERLQAALRAGRQQTPDNYAPEDWQELQDAIDDGQDVFDDPLATQREINEATKRILDAIKNQSVAFILDTLEYLDLSDGDILRVKIR